MATDWTSGLLPETVAREVLSAAREQSAVMSLATTRPMPSGVEWLPLVQVSPTAGWVDQPGGRKPYSEVTWSAEKLVARELGVTTAIADEYMNDAGFDAEGSVQHEFASAIATAFDDAILFGIDRPAGYPELVSGEVAAGTDQSTDALGALAALDAAMSVVESSGLAVTGIVAGPQVSGALRQAYLAQQGLPSAAPADQAFGVPIRIVPSWPADAGFDAIVGAWQYLQVGIRQDVSFGKSTDGVLTNPDGSIRVSAFESDATLLRCFARLAAVVGRPAGPGGQPVTPFAAARWTNGETEPAPEPEPATTTASKRKAS